MSTVASPAERLVVLHGVSWETYERLLAEHNEANGTRFTYSEGELEIVVLSARHEQPNRVLALLAELVGAGFGVKVCPLGSTTFKRDDLLKGFEPDSAFYIGRGSAFWGHDVDPTVDPPPDLTIEVDVTRESLDRFPIFAAFGVPEVWRYDGSRVAVFRLEGGQYVETEVSPAFPALTGALITQFLEQSRRLEIAEWIDRVREWARTQR